MLELDYKIINKCSVDDFKAFLNWANPLISKMEDNMAKFWIDMKSHEQIIKWFDEVILDKAQKFQIDEVYESLQAYQKKSDNEKFRQDLISR